jgi:hypothetical protein
MWYVMYVMYVMYVYIYDTMKAIRDDTSIVCSMYNTYSIIVLTGV